MKQQDPSTFPPNPIVTTPHGKLWQLDAERQRAKTPDRKDSSVLSYIIYAPWAHPLWYLYGFHLIHLRPVEGVEAPHIYLPGATHEIVLWACNPEVEWTDTATNPQPLLPWNFAAQMKWADDEEAKRVLTATAFDIVEGKLSPDTDYTRMWIDRFNDSMLIK